MNIKELLLLSTISGTENFNMPLGESGFADSNSMPLDGSTITHGSMHIPSNITDVTVYAILQADTDFDSFTINTDFIVSISLDNGSIFNNVTLTSFGTSTTNGLRRLYKGTLNLTGITNTNLFKLRYVSTIDPTINLLGIGAYFVEPEAESSLTADDVWNHGTRELTGIGTSGIASETNATANKDEVITEIENIPTTDPSAIADAVLDEPLAGHLTAGSVGKAIDDADAVADPSAVADAVWSAEDRSLTGEVDSDCLSIGTVAEVKAFIKKYAAGYTEKQLLALLLKQLKNS